MKSKQTLQDAELKIQLKKATFELIDVTLIDPNPYQPESRLLPKSIASLKAEILETGVIAPPVVAALRNGRYSMIDGHRRLAALGSGIVAAIWCMVVHSSDIGVLFERMNKVTRGMKGPDWLNVLSRAIDAGHEFEDELDVMPPLQRRHIKTLEELIGMDKMMELGRVGKCAPTIHQPVGTLLAVFREKKLKAEPANVIDWIINFNAQRLVYEENRRMTNKKALRFHDRVTKMLPWDLAKAPVRLRQVG